MVVIAGGTTCVNRPHGEGGLWRVGSTLPKGLTKETAYRSPSFSGTPPVKSRQLEEMATGSLQVPLRATAETLRVQDQAKEYWGSITKPR